MSSRFDPRDWREMDLRERGYDSCWCRGCGLATADEVIRAPPDVNDEAYATKKIPEGEAIGGGVGDGDDDDDDGCMHYVMID